MTLTVAGEPGARGWDVEKYAPRYPEAAVIFGTPGHVDLQGAVPRGTTFQLADDAPDGWAFGVEKHSGQVIAHAAHTIAVGSWAEVPVRVNYPDGSYDYALVHFTVEPNPKPQTESSGLHYAPATLAPGDTATLSLEGQLPDGVRIVGPNDTSSGWTVSTDPTTGAVTVHAPAGAAHGSTLAVDVAFYFADGSATTARADVAIS